MELNIGKFVGVRHVLLLLVILPQLAVTQSNGLEIIVKDSTISLTDSMIMHFVLKNNTNDTIFVENLAISRAEIIFSEKFRRLDFMQDAYANYYSDSCETLLSNYYNIVSILPNQCSKPFSINLVEWNYTLIGEVFDKPFETGKKYEYYMVIRALNRFNNCDKIFTGVACSKCLSFLLVK
ncbi:MAG: hypothetical protein K1X92_18090 [Bacteroidia bacterium]|nr:hypothetical protein [Bacteroidia bacterium]